MCQLTGAIGASFSALKHRFLVVLTERGHPIAVIKPVKAETAQEATLRGLVDDGLIAPAARKGPMPAPRWRPLKVEGKPLSQTLIDDREDRA
jgi:antitoxin (DNA-binding transcriptional repressor) of toxin-antitoxin stability system